MKNALSLGAALGVTIVIGRNQKQRVARARAQTAKKDKEKVKKVRKRP